jgi:hypothetical protein
MSSSEKVGAACNAKIDGTHSSSRVDVCCLYMYYRIVAEVLAACSSIRSAFQLLRHLHLSLSTQWLPVIQHHAALSQYNMFHPFARISISLRSYNTPRHACAIPEYRTRYTLVLAPMPVRIRQKEKSRYLSDSSKELFPSCKSDQIDVSPLRRRVGRVRISLWLATTRGCE